MGELKGWREGGTTVARRPDRYWFDFNVHGRFLYTYDSLIAGHLRNYEYNYLCCDDAAQTAAWLLKNLVQQ